MQIIEFLNRNSGALTVIVTAVYVIATILICYANIKSASASKKQLKEMRRQFAEEHRPQIEVEFLYEKRTFYGLRFVNYGKCTAQNVQIQLDSSFIDSISENDFSQMLQKQAGKKCTIGAGQHYDLFFGSNKYRKNPNKVAASGAVHYSYNGHEYESDFNIDLENYATIYSVNSEQEDIKNELSKQTSELHEIKQAIHLLRLPSKKNDAKTPDLTSSIISQVRGICTSLQGFNSLIRNHFTLPLLCANQKSKTKYMEKRV